MQRFMRLWRLAVWRAVEHDMFTSARAAAYYSILTLFPALMVLASVLAASHKTQAFLSIVAAAIGHILPPGSGNAGQAYFEGQAQRPIAELVSASIITLFAASGVIVSWMDGFLKVYNLPNTWGPIKQRLMGLVLVFGAFIPLTCASLLVAFGNEIESYMMFHTVRALGPLILLLWTLLRWLIAGLTSVAVIALIYHLGLPRWQQWYRVLPGASLATVMWLAATEIFGWYVTRFATYSLIYGSLGAAIALLVWMYMISLIVLIGAEFNALVYPRSVSQEPQAHPAASHQLI